MLTAAQISARWNVANNTARYLLADEEDVGIDNVSANLPIYFADPAGQGSEVDGLASLGGSEKGSKKL